MADLDLPGSAEVVRALVAEAATRRKSQRERLAKVERARQEDGLLDFIEYNNPKYRAGWFHRALCRIFEKFLACVIAGERPRYILSAPPQMGKSEVVSRNFPCWAQGRFPWLKFICSSYAGNWAESLSADRQRILESPSYQEIFPAVRLKRKQADYLSNTAEGFMLSAGIDGSITGRPSDIGIIDDPTKGYREAVSETHREKLKNWYRTDFYSRLQEGAGVVCMATRWHEEDLIGWLIAQAEDDSGDAWQVYNFQAVAEMDTRFRKAGEPLSPERFGAAALTAIKKVQGTYAWNALYQGRPAPPEGLMLKREHWRYYEKRPDGAWDLPAFDLILVSADCSFKANPDSDHVAIHAWGFVGARGYLLGRTCERMGYTATKSEIERMTLKHKADVLLIEDAANGSAVIEELTRTLAGRVTVIGITPEGGKIARAWPFSADLEAGNAYLPSGELFTGDIIDYAAKFPNTAMDHDIDAITQAFIWRRGNLHGLFQFLEAESMKANQPTIHKVEIAPQTQVCPNPECRSLAVRVNPDGSGRCNQCGGNWPSPNKEEENDKLRSRGRDLLK